MYPVSDACKPCLDGMKCSSWNSTAVPSNSELHLPALEQLALSANTSHGHVVYFMFR
jgi:hypothetical protein